MAPFYIEVCKDLGWSSDQSLVDSMKVENAKTLASIEESIKDAEENLGETEVRDLMIKKAEHYSRIGDRVSVVILGYSLSPPECCGAGMGTNLNHFSGADFSLHSTS